MLKGHLLFLGETMMHFLMQRILLRNEGLMIMLINRNIYQCSFVWLSH